MVKMEGFSFTAEKQIEWSLRWERLCAPDLLMFDAVKSAIVHFETQPEWFVSGDQTKAYFEHAERLLA